MEEKAEIEEMVLSDSVLDRESSSPQVAMKEKRVSSSSRWRSGLLLTASFALGGLAVTLWNRQTLARLHQELNGKGQPRPPETDDEG
ncbi:MAG: hypothetical protein ACYC46_12525 [Acidobacteriaceae bacterium]